MAVSCLCRSFAYLTVRDRLPTILTKVIDTIHRNKNKFFEEYGEVSVVINQLNSSCFYHEAHLQIWIWSCLSLFSYRRGSRQRSKQYLCCLRWGMSCKLISQYWPWQTTCKTQSPGTSTCRDNRDCKGTRSLSAGSSLHGCMWSATCTAGYRRPSGSSEKHFRILMGTARFLAIEYMCNISLYLFR